MEAESRYTLVGAVLIGLIVAVVAAVLWLHQLGGRDYVRYAVVFEQQPLDGLDVGAAVHLRGIQIGRVEDYALVGSNGSAVRVELRVDRRVPVRTDTRAVVTRNFVTGLAAITLVNRHSTGELLTARGPGDALPVIAEGRSDLDEIAGRVNQIGEVASLALARMADLLNEKNQQTLVGAVAGVRDLSNGLNQRLDGMQKALDQMAVAAAQAGSAAQLAAQSAGLAAGQLGDAGQRLARVGERSGEKLDRTLAQSEQLMAEARLALAQMTLAVAEVQRQTVVTAQRLEGTAANVDDQLRGAVIELRLSTEVAARALDRLRDPRASLLGPSPAQLGPGEKLP